MPLNKHLWEPEQSAARCELCVAVPFVWAVLGDSAFCGLNKVNHISVPV